MTMITEPSRPPRDAFVTVADGRRLAYVEYGDPLGCPVLAFHGLPGSRLQHHPDESIARLAGARIIHFDRPGVGLSDPNPTQTLDSWTRDVACAADCLNLERFAIAGVSAGGPFAIACATLLGERVTKVGVVGGVGPPGSMRTDTMPLAARITFGVAPHGLWMLRPALATLGWLASSHPQRYLDLVATEMAAMDRLILRRAPVRAMFANDLREAFRQGTAALQRELEVITSPWPFELGKICADIALWHGDEDRLIPPSGALHIARSIPGSRIHLCRGEGHFLALDRWDEIVRWLVA